MLGAPDQLHRKRFLRVQFSRVGILITITPHNRRFIHIEVEIIQNRDVVRKRTGPYAFFDFTGEVVLRTPHGTVGVGTGHYDTAAPPS